MATETLTKETAEAVKFFESKLAFEIGPYSLQHAIEEKEPIQVIDLRTPELFAKGHVPGALNIQLEELDSQLNKLSKDKTTVVYCYNITCALSAHAALHLAKKGYKVKELFGGFEDYAKANLKQESQHGSCATSKGSSCG
jgi:rhodanese-related sulfurtransferase